MRRHMGCTPSCCAFGGTPGCTCLYVLEPLPPVDCWPPASCPPYPLLPTNSSPTHLLQWTSVQPASTGCQTAPAPAAPPTLAAPTASVQMASALAPTPTPTGPRTRRQAQAHAVRQAAGQCVSGCSGPSGACRVLDDACQRYHRAHAQSACGPVIMCRSWA